MRGSATVTGVPQLVIRPVDPHDVADMDGFQDVYAAAERAEGLELVKGPRGGGRALDAIVDHVLGADASYVARLGRKVGSDDASTVREGIIDALRSAVRDGVPPSPRGGKRWTPRYFVRRSAWHVLDHAWEIEDRTPA